MPTMNLMPQMPQMPHSSTPSVRVHTKSQLGAVEPQQKGWGTWSEPALCALSLFCVQNLSG